LFVNNHNYKQNMKGFLPLLLLAYTTCGEDTFLVYPTQESGRQAKVLTNDQEDSAILFNLDGLFEDDEDRGAKNVDVDLSVDLDSVGSKDDDEDDIEKQDDIEELTPSEKKKMNNEDPRLEKSLLNTFPFNQGNHRAHDHDHDHEHGDHGDHGHHGDHGDHANHGAHGEHGHDHRDHHVTHEGEYSVSSSLDRSPASSPLRNQLSDRVRNQIRNQVSQHLGQRPPHALPARQSDTSQPARQTSSNLPSRFPFQGLAGFRQDSEEAEDPEEENSVSFNIIGAAATRDEEIQGGRKCIDKVMMVEVTEYNEIITCDHSYDQRCHTSYVTNYDTQQEEECEDNFKKICNINYEPLAYNETVEICRTPLVKDCNNPTEETVCQTVYETECMTKQKVHEVEDDVTSCETQQMVKCKDVTIGYVTKPECDEWPVERCTVEKKLVKKYTPETACYKEPRELCAPRGCGYRNGTVECYEKQKTIVVDNPQETCEIEPQRTCKHVTKLVPRLVAVKECVDVPKEICARSSNPTKVKKPIIKKWCYVPSEESGLL